MVGNLSIRERTSPPQYNVIKDRLLPPSRWVWRWNSGAEEKPLIKACAALWKESRASDNVLFLDSPAGEAAGELEHSTGIFGTSHEWAPTSCGGSLMTMV